jgi:hypothetical protein
MAIVPDSAYADMLAQKKAAPAPKAPADPFSALLNRLNTSAANVAKLEEVAKVATAPVKASTADLAQVQADRVVAQNAASQARQYAIPAGAQGATNTETYTQDIYNKLSEEQKNADRLSAYNILKMEFERYGLGSLVENIKGLLQDGTPAAEFALRLRETPEYQKRFSANTDRIKNGLAALSPAEYVAMEDQYQNIMRNYGLPATYYTKDATGKQSGFDQLLSNDVSAVELEDRVMTAQNRVINANPEVAKALKSFYPDVTNGDILAYALDPTKALDAIKRKVTAAEIGGAALAQGLQAQSSSAEALAAQGITKSEAQQGYQEVAGVLPRASQLSDIYGQGPYTQGTAEAEVFKTAGGAEAKRKREKLVSLEQAAFSGASGVGALGRDRALYGQAYGQQGQY